ncbi:MAG: stage 0 sporulation protein, partial [Candidatus Aenigmarchaeota archaeon]|nr:stage 0 sporulation protein [Candidatus Aenigmarchaeota archaeon]
FRIGERIIIKDETGTYLMTIIDIQQSEDKQLIEENKYVLRRANEDDIEKIKQQLKEKKQPALTFCKETIKKYKLPMKLIDVYFSYDGGKIIFGFIAPERVNFRDLLKDLNSYFHKTIRLYQIMVRQAIKLTGDIGPCGQPLCCRTFLKEMGKISSNLIDDQQLNQRGLDRLSGVCGRLKCCLAFEENNYRDLMKNLPRRGQRIKTKSGYGKVIQRHILKQTVDVKLEKKETRIEVPVNEITLL